MPLEVRSIRDYRELKDALNARRIDLKMSMLELDEIAGLQQGYSAKIFCKKPSARNFGPVSFGNMLKALGVEVLLIPTPVGRRRSFRISHIRDKIKLNRMVAIGRRGGIAKKLKMTPEEWKQFCRAGGLARARKLAKARKK